MIEMNQVCGFGFRPRIAVRALLALLLFAVSAPAAANNPPKRVLIIDSFANAPIFGIYENQLGLGVVGGRPLPNQNVGVEAARIALRILRGEVPSSIPTKAIESLAPIYDWRELRRWGISEARLPPGSILKFRQPTLWEQYRGTIICALAIMAVQAVSMLKAS
jgi:ABC-type uncharacterized transport system substrate-binding protein